MRSALRRASSNGAGSLRPKRGRWVSPVSTTRVPTWLALALRLARTRWPVDAPRVAAFGLARARGRSGVTAHARAPLSQLVDALRGLRLRQVLVERLPHLVSEGAQVGRLRFGHRLVAGLPVLGVSLQLIGH